MAELHRYTQEEFDALPVFNGYRLCPTGDYSEVSSFGEKCSFGEWCSFGEECSFGEGCRFGEWCSFGEECRFGEGGRFENGLRPDNWRAPYFAVDRIGSVNRKAYFFCVDGVMHIRAGCFFGDEIAFLAKLDADGDARKSRHYRAALELARDVLIEKGEAAP